MAPECVFEPEGEALSHGFERAKDGSIVHSSLTHEWFTRAMADRVRYDAFCLATTLQRMYEDAEFPEIYALAMLMCVPLPAPVMLHLCRLDQTTMRCMFQSVEAAMDFAHTALSLSSRLFSERSLYAQFARHFMYHEMEEAKDLERTVTIEFHVLAKHGGTIHLRRMWSANDPVVRRVEAAVMMPAPAVSFSGLIDGEVSTIRFFLGVRQCATCEGISIPKVCFYNQRSAYFFEALDDLRMKGYTACRCKSKKTINSPKL